jgi:hypothetical protein
MSGMAYKLNFGEPLPGFRFKPGECIVDSKSAEEFREGKVTAEQFDAVKMVVLEVGIDKRTEVESYHLLYDSELKVRRRSSLGRHSSVVHKGFCGFKF